MTASDDIVCAHHPRSDMTFHRPTQPGVPTPACGAASTEPYHVFGLWQARMWAARPCGNTQCYPQGWATPDPEGEQK